MAWQYRKKPEYPAVVNITLIERIKYKLSKDNALIINYLIGIVNKTKAYHCPSQMVGICNVYPELEYGVSRWKARKKYCL